MTQRLLVVVFACCILASELALAAGDAPSGHDLARRWCSGCHLVDQSGTGQDTAPPFSAIARRHAGDRHWLNAWLTDPHPPMPNLNLSRQQIDNVIAYLDSLAPR